MPSIPSPTTPSATTVAPSQVIVHLSTLIPIPDFSRFYPSLAADSFHPVYSTFDDGSLVASPLLDDLSISHILFVITGALLAFFLRNLLTSAIYLWRGKVKKKGILYILFFSQVLGPVAIIPIIVAPFDSSADCTVVLRTASIASGVSLSLLLTGTLGIKVYRCLDNNRLVFASLLVLSVAAGTILVLDAIYLRGFRSLSGRCLRPSAGLSSAFIMILLVESFLICACFLYLVWISHGPVAVRGRISVHFPPDDDHRQPISSVKKPAPLYRKRRDWSDDRPPASPPTIHVLPLSREPSIASIRHEYQRMPSYNTPATEPVQNTSCSPFPSVVHSPPHSFSVRIPSTTDGFHSPVKVTTPLRRPSSPMHYSPSDFACCIPRVSLFREVMRDELCYSAVITTLTVVSVAMTLVGVKSLGGTDTTIWITLDWALISLLVMHSVGRVIRRHENESLLLHPSAWYHDLHTDRTTAELLQDVPRPARTPRMFFRTGARSVGCYDVCSGVSPSGLSVRRLFLGSPYSSRRDRHTLISSTSGMSSVLPPVETDSLTRPFGGSSPVICEEDVRTMGIGDPSPGAPRFRKFAEAQSCVT